MQNPIWQDFSVSDFSPFAARLNALLAEAGQPPLDSAVAARFEDYLILLQRWNARINLTAIRDEEGILRRHFVECIAAARALPLQAGTLLDFGAGAGFPGIPIALCCPEIHVTLAESQGKKTAFLREAVRTMGVSSQVYGDRAEKLGKTFDCVTLRAVDKMEEAVQAATGLVRPGGWLVLLATSGTVPTLEAAAGTEFAWVPPIPLPGGEERLLFSGQKSV
jgi:16S rRNA (guanine527-N7)-methyltransferase